MTRESAPKGAPRTADQSDRPKVTARLAEDADEQFAEADRWLDASDLVILDVLEGGTTYTARDALEHALSAHSRIRRFLAFARVAA